MKECALLLGVLFLFLTSNGQQELLDTSYGVEGRSIVDFLDRDETRSTALDASDRLLIAGTHLFTSNSDLYVCRLTTEGEIDETFAEDGPTPGFFHYVPESSTGRWTPPIVRVLNSGRIVVGMSFIITDPDGISAELLPYIFVLNSDGTLDTTFGENGIVVLLESSIMSDICEGNNEELFVSRVVNPAGNLKQTILTRISGNGQEVDEDFAEDAIEYLSGPYFSFSPNKIIFSEGELLVLSTAVLPNPDSPSNSWPHQKYLVVWKISADSGQLEWDYGIDGSFEYHIVDNTDITDVISYVVAGAVLNYEDNLLVTLMDYGSPGPALLLKIDSAGQLRSDYFEGGIMEFNYPASSCNKFTEFAKHPSNGYYIIGYNAGILDECASSTVSICQVNDDGVPLNLGGGIDGSIEIHEGFTVHRPRVQIQSDGKLIITSFYFPNQDNNDTDIKSIRIHTDLVSSVHETENSYSIHPKLATYPNPATDQLRIKLELPQEAGGHNTFELVMHDLQGRVVYRQNHPGLHLAEGSINVSDFAPGVYTLHCMIDGVWVDSEKVVVGR